MTFNISNTQDCWHDYERASRLYEDLVAIVTRGEGSDAPIDRIRIDVPIDNVGGSRDGLKAIAEAMGLDRRKYAEVVLAKARADLRDMQMRLGSALERESIALQKLIDGGAQ